MPTTHNYFDAANKKVLPIYSLLFIWDEEVTGTEIFTVEFRLVGSESQVTLDAIMRPENGGNRIVGFKAVANIYITDSTITIEDIEKILFEKPSRCYVDLRPFSTGNAGYSHSVLSLSNYDDIDIERKELTEFSLVAFKQETTNDIYKTNFQVSFLIGKEKLGEFWQYII